MQDIFVYAERKKLPSEFICVDRIDTKGKHTHLIVLVQFILLWAHCNPVRVLCLCKIDTAPFEGPNIYMFPLESMDEGSGRCAAENTLTEVVLF